MLKLMASLTDLETQRKEMVKQDQLVEFNKQRKAELAAKFANMELAPASDTPVMEQADTYEFKSILYFFLERKILSKLYLSFPYLFFRNIYLCILYVLISRYLTRPHFIFVRELSNIPPPSYLNSRKPRWLSSCESGAE